MDAKAILVGAVMLGGIGGYGWSALQPSSAGSAPARQSDAAPARGMAPGPRTIIPDEPALADSDREWASRAHDGGASQPPAPAASRAIEQSVYYAGCNAPRAAGKTPIYAGQPGYRAGLDGDGDGIACEPPRR
jgi:hypothetical protein